MTDAVDRRADARAAASLADDLPDWVARFDGNLRCVEGNLALSQAARLAKAELVGRSAAELRIAAPLAASWQALLSAAQTTQRHAEQLVPVPSSEGRSRLYLMRVVAQVDAPGQLAHLLATATDITASGSCEKEVRNAGRLARIQQVTSSFSQAITRTEVADVLVNQGCQALNADAGLVMLVNPERTHLEVVRAVGYPAEAVRLWREIPLDAAAPLSDAVRSGAAAFFETHHEVTERYPHLAEQRHQVDEALAAIPLTVEGRTLGAIALVFRRPTNFMADDRAFAVALAAQCAQALERARLYDAEARARQQAESANRAKDEFLATMSHELRTPLQAIFGWVALLRNKRLDPTTYERAVASIDKGARSQARLIDDIFDTARIISGKITLNYGEADFAAVVQSAVDLMRPAAAAKEITLKLLIDNASTVRGDADRLQQVVSNLVGNAVKFTPRGGQVQVVLARTADAVTLRIADSGQGIAADVLPHVFERFWQADSSTTRRHGGLGLGLSIAKHLVELHGGTLRAESPGRGLGATFAVEIPTASGVGEPAAVPYDAADRGAPSHELAGLRVLLVDDDPDGREAAAAVLGARGAEVMSAGSAHDALACMRTHAPDVLVCDIGMPDVDGYQLMNELGALAPDRSGRVPAVALTAYVTGDDVRRALSAGFAAHVAKPMDPEALVNAIVAVVGGASTIYDADERSRPLAEPTARGELGSAVDRRLASLDAG